VSVVGAEFLARPGGQVAYDDSGGDGPLVLCAPGMGDVRSLYRFLTPRLVAAGYRVVTMDLRGHGESTTGWPDHSPEAVGEDMIALLRHLDPGRPAAIVGESFTPASAIWAAAEAPDLVAGIVLCAPFFREQKPNPLMRALVALVTRSPVLWSDVFYPSLYKTSPPPDLKAYRRALRAHLRQPGRMAALRAMAHASKARANARLADVACPVLVLMGTRDPDFADPADEARLAAGTARDGSVVMIEGAGHYPPAEMPEQTAAALLPFLHRALAGHRAA
jgi:pimeloyl-ACP methyl ester carboxylesterase